MVKKITSAEMYFAELEIENIKCFGDKQKLDLKDKNGNLSQWTLILGDNGFGKTTLLKCLAWMVPVEETDKGEKEKNGIAETMVAIKPFMDGFENESEYEQLIRIGENMSSRVGAKFAMATKLGNKPDTQNLISHAINIKTKSSKLEEIILEYGAIKEFNSPNLYAYSASRHMAFKNFDKSELKEHTSNLFSDSGDLYDAEQLLTLLDTASIRQKEQGIATNLLKKVKEILAVLLPDIKKPEDIIINSPLKEDGSTNEILVEVQTEDGKVPLFNLSLGYKTMLALTVDLALRMLWNNPGSEFPLKEPAVVIIDEIDLHLHPKWQREVRKHFTEHFPKTQFICTAHSPFMAQSSELENLCVINRIGDGVKIENEPLVVKGWRIGQFATSDLFGVSSERSPDVEELINERRIILDKEKRLPEDEIKLKELDEKISDLPVLENDENQKLLDQIQKAAELLKKTGGLNND
jgi:predicted ATP-binding protein involved in virulence